MREDIIICPVHNEQDTIEEFAQNLRKYYLQDVLFVDDGSVDRGKDFLHSIQNRHTFLVTHPKRLGYGAALLSGFKFSLERGYKRLITMDVDLQHNPEHVPKFLSELAQKEVILGSRYVSGYKYPNVPPERLAINRYISGLINILFSINFTDPFCGFRGYRDSFLRKVNLTQTGYGLGLEIVLEIIKNKTPFIEIPIDVIYHNNHLRRFLDGLDNPRERLIFYLDIILSKKNQINMVSSQLI